jgi:hypothetical protein
VTDLNFLGRLGRFGWARIQNDLTVTFSDFRGK